jgi:glycosyltransferase involved in cell wall biosynthesis
VHKNKIGVIIPFYGSKQKLFRTLESVYHQSLNPDYVVLIDDCGPDPLTKEDESHWQSNIPQLIYLYNEQNLGAGFTRNVGMDYLEGKVAYLHFLDSDDCIAANFYQEMMQSIKLKTNLAAVFSRTIYQNERGDINPELKETSLYEGLFRYRPWATSSLLWRSDNLENIRWINLKSCEDTFFELSVAKNSDHISGVGQTHLRVHQINDELTREERRKANVIEQHANRIQLYRFAMINISKRVWFYKNNVNVFVRRNIDLKFDRELLKVLFFSTVNLSRLNLVGYMMFRYVYLKVAISIYNFGK